MMFNKKKIFRFLTIGTLLLTLLLLSLFTANKLVENSAKGLLFSTVSKIPSNKVGLLLGTIKTLKNGRLNLYYKYRIKAAHQLFVADKIKYILISGDNSTKNYDEPTTMKKDLISLGVPAEKIFLDYAGFRTFDSMVRCKNIFGQDSVTVISQPFHNERAIYIAKSKGMYAVGFNAKDVSIRYGIKIRIREYFARVKMILDLILCKEPHFMGKKIEIKK